MSGAYEDGPSEEHESDPRDDLLVQLGNLGIDPYGNFFSGVDTEALAYEIAQEMTDLDQSGYCPDFTDGEVAALCESVQNDAELASYERAMQERLHSIVHDFAVRSAGYDKAYGDVIERYDKMGLAVAQATWGIGPANIASRLATIQSRRLRDGKPLLIVTDEELKDLFERMRDDEAIDNAMDEIYGLVEKMVDDFTEKLSQAEPAKEDA